MARRASLAWAGISVALTLAAALLLGRYAPVQTDLLALLPPTERSVAAERAVAAMRDAAGNRAVFLIGDADAASARRAAGQFAAALRESGAFASVQLEVPDAGPQRLTAAHREFRFGLLTDADRAVLADGSFDIEQWLLRRLNDPFRTPLGGSLAQDPFGFFDNFIASLPYRHLRFDLDDGLLVVRGKTRGVPGLHVLVSAELAGSAYDDRVQRSSIAAVAAAEAAAHRVAPQAQVLRAGAVFFAEAARGSAEHDVELIGLGSLAGIVLLMLAVFRSVWPLALGLLTVLTGLAAAVSATVLAHGEVHLLTLVFGASLIGEAIDYSIQYFCLYAGAGGQWDPRRGLAAVRPGLSLALATSALGYGALMLMPFPAVRQIALFALAGLVAAFLSVLLLLPELLRRPYRRDLAPIAAPASRLIGWWTARVGAKPAAAMTLTLLVLCVPGWLQLRADDDVRALSSRPPALLEQEARIRALTGVELGARFFVVEAATPEATLQAEERLTARLRALVEQGELAHYQAVSVFVPSAARQAENRELLRRNLQLEGNALAEKFRQIGLKSAAAVDLAAAYRESEGRLLTPQTWAASPTAGPFRHLWLGRSGEGYASVVVPGGAADNAALEALAAGIPGVTFVDKAASVSRLFAQYRKALSYGLGVALLLVLGVLSWRYGLRGGAAVLLPAVLGMAAALALAGYAGSAVTLFNAMALLLVLGVGVNYSIFLVEGRSRAGSTVIAVALSAATTMLSFGLLAFSGTPALAGFGATLLAGIAVTVLGAPLSLSLGRWEARR
jgi:predicted exporter